MGFSDLEFKVVCWGFRNLEFIVSKDRLPSIDGVYVGPPFQCS